MRNNQNKQDHIRLWTQIKEGKEDAFHQLFEQQYRSLLIFGMCVNMDRELAKDMIQELFLELWNKKETLP